MVKVTLLLLNNPPSPNTRGGEIHNILLHEIIEAILVHNLVRYYGNEGNQEFRFMFNHTEFVKIVADITMVLKENKMINKLIK